jgi:hypothetical protein
MATPHVAGAVALLKQLYPDRTSEWYKLKLKNNARDLGESYESQGAGLLDLLAATEGYTLVYFPMVKIHSP